MANGLNQIQIPCSVEVTVKMINSKAKTGTILSRLISPEGEAICTLPDTYHRTDTHELNEGDKLTFKNLLAGVKVEGG